MPRAIAPVLGAVLLVGVTVLLVVVLTVAVTGFAFPGHASPVVIEASADAGTGRVTLEHVSGPPLDVNELSLHVEVDDEALLHQPPVPFFSADGFYSGPTGPFNPSADQTWSGGEIASFGIAGSNDPALKSGSTLTVTVSREDQLVARATTTAR